MSSESIDQEYTPSDDSFVRAWQSKTAREVKSHRSLAKKLLSGGVVTLVIASGIGYVDGDTLTTAEADLGGAVGLLSLETVSRRNYREDMNIVRHAGERPQVSAQQLEPFRSQPEH